MALCGDNLPHAWTREQDPDPLNKSLFQERLRGHCGWILPGHHWVRATALCCRHFRLLTLVTSTAGGDVKLRADEFPKGFDARAHHHGVVKRLLSEVRTRQLPTEVVLCRRCVVAVAWVLARSTATTAIRSSSPCKPKLLKSSFF